MKFVFMASALVVLWPGTASADVILRKGIALPCIELRSGNIHCPRTLDIHYRETEGDQVLVRIFPVSERVRGIRAMDLPSFIREVPTTHGSVLQGNPRSENNHAIYRIKLVKDGEYFPGLDLHLRFIPQ
ncbi:MAG TPA: hypothetical protein VGN93_03190 [Shinella sp.]|jgi:hypothetical protein|uniref:hypothetical protein n=1 Tax=Shinella sp. TaxID=1870904 RepID=UPI002E145CCB|nr:hypothetical protein [Shinella sp.]